MRHPDRGSTRNEQRRGDALGNLSAADIAQCNAAMRAGSKSFHAASLLLPARMRVAARAVYAFCRETDDLVDGSAGARGATDQLSQRLDAIASGQPGERLCDRAFHAVICAYAMPIELPRALIEGFRWDESGRRYATLNELQQYAARVASTVGVMMCVIMGRRDPHVLARASELGLAMQLTNIARDVGDDARAGRLYLPLDWLEDESIDPEAFLSDPRHSPALGRVVKRLLDEADTLYRRAMTGIAGLPPSCRPAIAAAALTYRDIGTRIRASGFDSVSSRAHTSAQRKAVLVACAVPSLVALTPVSNAPAPSSVRFLVDVAAQAPAAQRGFDAAAGRFIELLASCEQHERRMTALAQGKV